MKTQSPAMPLYPVGIARSSDVPTVAGQTLLGQIAVRWIFTDELACAVIDASESSPEPLEHVLAVDAIHRWISVLPMRFGNSITDEDGISRLLLGQRQELLDCLDRVEDAYEMGLRITPSICQRPEVGVPVGTCSGVDYLARRRALYQYEDQLTGQTGPATDRYVHGLDGFYRQWKTLPPSSTNVIRLAFLVQRDRVGLFRDRVKVLRSTEPGELCELVGPWPPYSFV